jgi:hypothetical protein
MVKGEGGKVSVDANAGLTFSVTSPRTLAEKVIKIKICRVVRWTNLCATLENIILTRLIRHICLIRKRKYFNKWLSQQLIA